MAWSTDMVKMLQSLIGDYGGSKYSETQLRDTILIAAQLLSMEITTDTTYTVDLSAKTLSPDPTDSSTKDDTYTNLVVLKAATIILNAEAKLAAYDSVRVSQDKSTIDGREIGKLISERANEIQRSYDKILAVYNMGIGAAVSTPVPIVDASKTSNL